MNLNKGFTLLEILLAIIVITVGMVSVLTAFSRGIFVSATASDFQTASALAQGKMEEIKDTAFASISSEARASVSNFAGFDRAVSVASIPGGSGSKLKQVAVTIYWETKGGEISQTLTTYIVNKSN